MTDEQNAIYEWVGNVPAFIPDWKKRLPAMYADFNEKYFSNSLPKLGLDFVCEFCDFPGDAVGICILQPDAQELFERSGIEVRLGIRIRSELKFSPDHVQIVLLHEMIHASGIRGHGTELRHKIIDLFAKGAYLALL
jgi:hypothetical protein